MRDTRAAHEHLDDLLVGLAERARPVPSLVPDDAAEARAARIAQLSAGETPAPLPTRSARMQDSGVFRIVDAARRASETCELGDLYRARLDELELDFAILDAWGDSRRVRPLCARRYGRGDEPVSTQSARLPLDELARGLLRTVEAPAPHPRSLPAWEAAGGPSVGRAIIEAALGIGLDADVKVEPRLSSLAATGERTVFISARTFTEREAQRLAAHEVFGHLVAAANARTQPLRLLKVGLADSFADQEGLALYIEEALGLMCGERLRTLAARVLATRFLHDGASFGETARTLYAEHGFSAEAAVLLAERAHRGGGVARDAGYLLGYLRVREALRQGQVQLDELRAGRVSVQAAPRLRPMLTLGLVRPPCYAPSLARMRTLVLGREAAVAERAVAFSPCAAFSAAGC
jgi:uncharacterized protein (TIGR02421 family)